MPFIFRSCRPNTLSHLMDDLMTKLRPAQAPRIGEADLERRRIEWPDVRFRRAPLGGLRKAPRDPTPTVRTSQPHAAALPASPAAVDRLSVRVVPLPGGPPPDPVDLLEAVPAGRGHTFWHGFGGAPEGRTNAEALVGVGTALRLVAAPEPGAAEAIVALGESVREAFACRLDHTASGATSGLRAFFTLAFDPREAFGTGDERERWRGFEPVEALIPEILVRWPGEGGRPEALLVGPAERLPELTAELEDLVTRARPPAEEPGAGDLEIEWAAGRHRRAVETALEVLHETDRESELSKVVLAHAVEVRRRRPFEPAVLLAALRDAYPRCFLFSVRPAEQGAVFLGASPERLVRVGTGVEAPVETGAGPGSGDAPGGLRVSSGALAGTAPRGATPEEDRRLGAALLASAKDRQEHAIVEEMIFEALEPLCSHVTRGGEPSLDRLDNVQHLFTPVDGVLEPGRTLFDAVAALHPTPAVGGMPRERAMAAIRSLEAAPRGLYAGVVGWVDPEGHGDCAVAIRSALVDGERARLYAGGGIVPTSDPDVEVEEIRIKAAAVLGAMKSPSDEASPRPDRTGRDEAPRGR
ncbi:MAG: chorismate-binding protein [Acidobacteriota bacterium]